MKKQKNLVTINVWEDLTLPIRQLCQQLLVDKADGSRLTRLQREIVACITCIRCECEHLANMHGTVVNLMKIDDLPSHKFLYHDVIEYSKTFETQNSYLQELEPVMMLVMDVLEESGNPIVTRDKIIKAGYTKEDIMSIVGIVSLMRFMCTYLIGLEVGNTSCLPIDDSNSVFEQYIGSASTICAVGYKVLNDDEILVKKTN